MADLFPDRIVELGTGFWGAKVLLSAVELGVFSTLAQGPLDGETLRARLGIHPRSARDFFDALVALGMLGRDRDRYANTPETDLFLDRAKPSYMGGLLEMLNFRLYGFWGSLTEALRTGQPQNESKFGGGNLFDALYSDPARLRLFLQAMTGVSLGAAKAMAQKFPWKQYRTFVDIGAAQGGLPVQVALAHAHLTGGGFDLPVVARSSRGTSPPSGSPIACASSPATSSPIPSPAPTFSSWVTSSTTGTSTRSECSCARRTRRSIPEER